MQEYTFSPITPDDGEEIVDLFNYYVENSYAAYPEQRVPSAFFGHLYEACRGYPTTAARAPDRTLAGFCLLRPHNPMPSFRRTAEITSFIRPDLTGRGLGTRMVHRVTEAARQQGITTILASISSLNEGSIRFHRHNGFVECGRFQQVAEKRGHLFDTVWMQKFV